MMLKILYVSANTVKTYSVIRYQEEATHQIEEFKADILLTATMLGIATHKKMIPKGTRITFSLEVITP